MDRVKIFVPATIGNVGPGFDVLGLALEGIGDTVTVERTANVTTIASITGRDAELVPKDPAKNAVSIAANAVFTTFGIKQNLTISIDRQLPISGGLGSSAASSVAGAMAAAYLAGKPDALDDILRGALAGEASVAGRHLDNIAPCVYGGLTIVLGIDPPKVVRVNLKRDWWIAVVTPQLKLKTKDARAVLPASLPQAEWVKQMAYTAALVAAFSQGDEANLSTALHDPYAEPRRSALIPKFLEAKAAALAAGALGCSISGAGPTTFAIAADEIGAIAAAHAMTAVYGTTSTYHVGSIARQGARLL